MFGGRGWAYIVAGIVFDRFRATMETTLDTLAMSLASLAHVDRMGEFWVVRGQQNILAQARSIIANAQTLFRLRAFFCRAELLRAT